MAICNLRPNEITRFESSLSIDSRYVHSYYYYYVFLNGCALLFQAWIKEKEPLLQSTNYGNNLFEVQKLQKKLQV